MHKAGVYNLLHYEKITLWLNKKKRCELNNVISRVNKIEIMLIFIFSAPL